MHAVSYRSDAFEKPRAEFGAWISKEQVLRQVQELVDDIIDSVDLAPAPPPNLEDPTVQGKLFEERNADLGLYYTPEVWGKFQQFQVKLLEFCEVNKTAMGFQPRKPSKQADDEVLGSGLRRGRIPLPPPKVEKSEAQKAKDQGLPFLEWDLTAEQLRVALVQLQVHEDFLGRRRDMLKELESLVRQAQQ